MKFTTQYIIILLIILTFLGIFLYYLNELTKKQAREEAIEVALDVASSAANQEGFEGGVGSGSEDEANCPNLLINRGDAIVLYNTRARSNPNVGTEAGTHVVAIFRDLDEYAEYVQKQQAAGNYCPVLYLRQETDAQGEDVYRMYSPSVTPVHMPIGGPSGGSGAGSLQQLTPENASRSREFGPSGPVPTIPGPIQSVPGWNVRHEAPFYIEGGLPALPTEPVDTRNAIQALDASRENGIFNQNNYPGYDPYGLYVGKVTNIDMIHHSTKNQDANGNYKGCSLNPYDENWCGVMQTQQAVDTGMYAENEVKKVLYPKMGRV